MLRKSLSFMALSFFISSDRRLRFLLWMCLGLTSLQTVQAQTRPTAHQVTIEKKLIEGKKFTLLGDWEKAEAIYKAILEEDVQNSVACYELSRTLSAAGKTADALTYIRKAIRIEPDNEWYLLMEADIHEKAGDLHATMEMYDRLIALRPKKVHYYEMQIQFCKRTGESVRLLSLLDKYESWQGVTESITRTRFETLDALGRKEEALAAIHKLTEVFPSNIEYKFLAAAYAVKAGKEEQARQYYTGILALEPENARARLAMAGTEKEEGNDAGYLQSIVPVITNPALAIDVKLQELIPYIMEYAKTKDPALGESLKDVTARLVQTHPQDARSYAIRGDVLAQLGRDREAIDAYLESTRYNTSVYVVWEQLLALLLEERSYDEAITQADRAIDIFPNQAYLYYAKGHAAFRKGRPDEARDLLNEALIMTGRNAGQKISVYNMLGLVYDELGDLEKSSMAFETALGLNPKQPETLAYYSLALSRRISQSDKAMSMTAKLREQEPLTPLMYEVLSEVLWHQKKYTDALSMIQKSLAADPHGDAYNLAGDIYLKLNQAPAAVDMWQKALEAGCRDSELKQKIAAHKAQ